MILGVISLLVRCYFCIGRVIENSVIDIFILLSYLPFTQVIFDRIISDAVLNAGYNDIKRVTTGDIYRLKLFTLRYGFTEMMLKKLTNNSGKKTLLLLIDDNDLFTFSKLSEDNYSTTLNGEKFDYCAGDIVLF